MTMLELAQQHDVFQADFDQLQARGEGSPDAAGWLAPLRAEALRQFRAVGWPGPDDEEWRFTSVKPISDMAFSFAPDGRESVSPAAVAPHRIAGAIELVFVNGVHRPELSLVPASSVPGAQVLSLAEALRRDPVFVRAHLARYARARDDAFTALNTAFIYDGASIHVAAGAALEAPIHLLFLSSSGPSGAALAARVSHPHNLVVAGSASRVTVIEDYVALDEGVYWSNAVTEVVVGPGAHVQHYLLEHDSEQAFNVETLRVVQAAESHFESHTALFGGALVRNNIHVDLAGDDCHSLVNGLFVGRGRQHMDNHMHVVHAGLRGASRQFYHGILDGQARGVFTGRILVRPGAQQTDAKQTNRNLLLSDEARIDTRPQLEIYADDVKCTHGATTGRLDQAAAFYLQARGLSPETARALLIYAFARAGLERMPCAPVRARLERQLLERLPHAPFLRAALGGPESPGAEGRPIIP